MALPIRLQRAWRYLSGRRQPASESHVEPIVAPGRAAPRSMLSEGMLYAAGVIVARSIGFVTIPIFTRALSPAEYGRIDLIDTTSTVLHCLIGVSVTTALMRQYERRTDARHGDQIVGSAILGMLAITALTAAALWSVAPRLARTHREQRPACRSQPVR